MMHILTTVTIICKINNDCDYTQIVVRQEVDGNVVDA